MAIALSSNTPVTPCSGIIVKAEEANDVVTFSNEIIQHSGNQGYIEITMAKSNAQQLILDQALLSYNPGDDLGKIAIFEGAPKVCFTKDNKELAILSTDSTDMLPLKFKAEENGAYTMRFELKELDLSYLHLIDNMTGVNTDLLTTPTYTFNATTSDYTSRFKLVFDPHYDIEEHENEGFAYYSNGVIHLDLDTQGLLSLQVIDMTGHVIMKRDAINRVSTSGMTPGCYVLRLITSNGVKMQKIMIQ